MRIRIFTYMVIMSCTVMFFGNSSILAKPKFDLVKIAEIVENEGNMNITGWSVFAREINTEIATKKEFERKVSTLKEEFPQFNWSIAEDQDVWKAEASWPHAKNKIIEKIRFVSAKEHNTIFTYIIYQVDGVKWDKDTFSSLLKTYETKKNNLFQGNPSVFSCIKGFMSGNMNSVLENDMKKQLNLFKATEIEGVQERNFSSVSAHSPFFSETLTKKGINMQIGLRKNNLDSTTNFVIGTPIITFEY